MLGSTVDTRSCVSLRWHLVEFWHFIREGGPQRRYAQCKLCSRPFRFQRNAWSSVVHAVRQLTELYVDSQIVRSIHTSSSSGRGCGRAHGCAATGGRLLGFRRAENCEMPQLHFLLQMRILLGGFRTFPRGKKCAVGSAPESEGARQWQPIHAGCSAGGRALAGFLRVGAVQGRQLRQALLLEQTYCQYCLEATAWRQGRVGRRKE